ncbi:MAG TPA: hypothetical protein PLU22_05410 [Polyangiaceae bacterium]|nr:hypothetical protein [Polyangiaceae bacterium]
MTRKQGRAIAVTSTLLTALLGCSADGGTGPASVPGTGGEAGVTASGGATTGGDGSGGGTSTGGAPATGGAPVTGGTPTTGGLPGTGGKPGTGGATGGSPGTGGGSPTTGGVAGTGGSSPTTGGVAGTGGDPGTGGATGGLPGTGGAPPTGGLATAGASTGGVPETGGGPGSGGEGTGGTTVIDPSTVAAINACMDQLPWGAPDLSAEERAPIVEAIIKTCAEFAPPGEEWQQYCQMFLVAAINAESSYDALAGSVGAGNDPTIGLLQIRFSSTVVDFADYGPVDALERIGCDFGTVTSSDSYATKGEMMLDVTCNIAIGAWYYFIFGSGNGGDTAVWVWGYCQGDGVPGSLHIGMACHLMGAEAAHSSLSGADFYYDQIKEWFDPCVTYTGTHPFERTLEPDIAKYCG